MPADDRWVRHGIGWAWCIGIALGLSYWFAWATAWQKLGFLSQYWGLSGLFALLILLMSGGTSDGLGLALLFRDEPPSRIRWNSSILTSCLGATLLIAQIWTFMYL